MGAGSFAGGFARGLNSGINWSGAANAANALDERRNKKEIERIDKGAQAEYEAAGSKGTFEDFYRDYIVPRKTAAYLQQGDMDSAEAWREWAESDAARDGSKLFADGIVLAQTGDTEGALRKFIKAGNLRGYGKDLDLGNLTKNADGSMTISFDAPDGRKLAQTFTSADEVLNFGATFFNPEAAFERWSTQQTAAASSAAEIDKYRREKEIDVQLGISGPASKIDPAANYDKARKQALEELNADMNFMDLSSKKQRKAIEQRTNEILRSMGTRPVRSGGKKQQQPTKAFNPETGEVTDIQPTEAAPAETTVTRTKDQSRISGGAGSDRLSGGKGSDRGLGGGPASGPTPSTKPAQNRTREAERGVVGITGVITGGAPAQTFAQQYAPASATPTSAPTPPPSPTPSPTPAPSPSPAPVASQAVTRRMAAELARLKPGSPEYQQLAAQIRAARAA